MRLKNKAAIILSVIYLFIICFVLVGCDGDPNQPKPTDTSSRSVDFYAINDFHGSTERISTVGGYLKGRKNANPNTVLLNSGDMFQGSMESNSNYGKLLTDCMEAIGFDAFTLGNHEFDWGLEKLTELSDSSDVPFLGANIYNWNADTREWGEFASDIAQEYTITELDNGLKVGIIGVIGQNQITSISSNLVQTIGFKDPLPIVKNLATELRNDKNCDVVVVSIHAASNSLKGGELSGLVDAVFCAHSHSYELDEYQNGIPYIQGGYKGEYVSHIGLTISPSGKVSVVKHENINYRTTWDNLLVVDNIVDNSNAQIAEEGNKILTVLRNSLNSGEELPRLVCRAIAEYAVDNGYDISLSMANNSRKPVDRGELSYFDLYEALPFDNVVYIAKVKGADILHEASYSSNSVWRVSGEAIVADNYYFIAVIDYLLFHQNISRNYDYFPSAFSSGFVPVALENDDYFAYNYRLITRDYILNNDIDCSDYRFINANTNKNLQYAVEL